MIDVTTVNFGYFAMLLLLVFVASLIGSFLGPYRRILSAIVATILFGIGFIAWNYYPHGLPLPSSPLRAAAPAAQPAAAAPAQPAPARPSNPVRDITPRQ